MMLKERRGKKKERERTRREQEEWGGESPFDNLLGRYAVWESKYFWSLLRLSSVIYADLTVYL